MTQEIQALVARLECEAKLLRLSCPDTPILRHRLPTLFEEAATALVQQAQELVAVQACVTAELERRISDYKAVVEALHVADKRVEAAEAALATVTAELDAMREERRQYFGRVRPATEG